MIVIALAVTAISFAAMLVAELAARPISNRIAAGTLLAVWVLVLAVMPDWQQARQLPWSVILTYAGILLGYIMIAGIVGGAIGAALGKVCRRLIRRR